MAKACNKLSLIFSGVLLVSLLFLGDLAHGRKLVNVVPESGETVEVGGVFQAGRHLQDQGVSQSTGLGHSPGVGHLASETEDFQVTDPGHGPGVVDSTRPEVQNPSYRP